MDPYERQKAMQKASSGRMFLMFGGLMLVFTAVTSTLMYGINMFLIASEAAKGTADYVEALETANMTVATARIVGVAFLTTTIVEVTVGIICARFSNRVDKADITQKVIIVLLAEEIVMQIFLIAMHMPNPAMLVSAIILPVFMLWGVSKFKKLAKEDPDRIYAIEKRSNTRRNETSSQSSKSIRERAMMPTVKKSEPSQTKPAAAVTPPVAPLMPDEEHTKTDEENTDEKETESED